MLRLAQQRKREAASIPEDALVAGKGLGEDRTNGAAARPAAAAREGRAKGGESPREGEGRGREEMNLSELSPLSGRAVNETSSSELAI